MSQFEQWEGDSSQLEQMVKEAKHNLKLCHFKLCGNHSPDKLNKIYDRKLSCGGFCSAVCFITNHKGCGVMLPDEIEELSGKPMNILLRGNHLSLCHIDPLIMEDYIYIPEFVPLLIIEDNIKNVAKNLSGGSGLNGFNSTAPQNMLLKHRQASKRLRYVLTDFSDWLANSFLPWAAFHALMMCWEVAYCKINVILLVQGRILGLNQ